MNDKQKGILIQAIINALNEPLKKQNAELCSKNLYSEQKPLHGADMFFRLAFLSESELKQIANLCGI